MPAHTPQKFYSISRRFSLALVSVVILALFIFAAIAIALDISRINAELDRKLANTLQLAETSLVQPLWNFDHSTIANFVEALFLDDTVVYARIFEGTQIFAEKSQPEYKDVNFDFFANDNRFFTRQSSIFHEGSRIGTIQIALSYETIREELRLNVIIIITLTVLVIVSISLTSFVISKRYIARPLLQLQLSAERIARGELEAPIDVTRLDEIGNLANNLNDMRDSIRQLFEALRSSNAKLEESNRTLEQNVEARTLELAEAMEEAQVARAIAEDANRAKSVFLANMSHELRTPLNAIIGYSEMMLEEVEHFDKEQAVADLSRIQNAGRHLLGLISDVLDLSKIEAGRMELVLETFELSHVIEEVASTIRPLAEQNNNAFVLDYPENLGQMKADQTKVRQILFNLLNNACKFSKDGTVSLTVTPESILETDWITFEVKDTGIGITKEQMNRLFQPFVQADASTTREYGGTGLGLAISRQFCQMMEGDITVESQVNIGSVFTVKLPTQVSTQYAPVKSIEKG